MDVLKMIQQIDELFYEVFAALVFFPKTLWLLLRFPQRMMDYADDELGDVLNEQYNDTISPPKFMMLCIGIGYLSERAQGRIEVSGDLPVWMQNWEAALTFRMLLFSIIPLVTSLQLVRNLGQALDRKTLRPPFYSQCYLGGILIFINIIVSAMYKSEYVSGYFAFAFSIVGFGWYIQNQALWFKCNLGIGYFRGLRIALRSLLIAFVSIAVLVILAFAI